MAKRIAIVGAVAAGMVVVALGAAFGFRDALASWAAERGMADAGFACDRVAVHVPASFPPSVLQLAPMRCTSASGPVASIRFAEPLDVQLDGLRARSVSCAAIAVNLRQQHRGVKLNALGDLSRVAGMDQPAVDLLLDWAVLAQRRLPSFTAARAVVSRAGHRVVEMRGMRIWPDHGGQSMSAANVRVDKMAAFGDAKLTGHSVPDRTAMTLVFGQHLRIDVTGHRLDERWPKVDFAVSRASAGE